MNPIQRILTLMMKLLDDSHLPILHLITEDIFQKFWRDNFLRFNNKIAVVTGGATGIGQNTAIALTKEGAKVAIIDINQENGGKLEQETEGISFYYCDLRDVNDLRNVFKKIQSDLGAIDILVNSAGLANRTGAYDITEEEWDLLNDVNLKATYFCAQAAAKSMRAAKKSGRIINMASIRAHQADGRHTIYDATKAGVQAVTRSLAVAFAADGITVNTVAPGYVLSPMTEHNLEDENWLKWLCSRIPLGRMIEYREVVETILFFCSDVSSGITGQNLYVDGGWSVHE
jgi:NAD(P)-dependent dehydrogenase (short-subunit alcohol dehydrogenase family)